MVEDSRVPTEGSTADSGLDRGEMPGAAVDPPGDSAMTQTWPEPRLARPSRRLRRGQSVGRYVILDALGDGGMGVVYSAYDPELDRRVAVKLLRLERFSGSRLAEARLRLQREAQALARLNHPHVVGVYDVGAVALPRGVESGSSGTDPGSADPGSTDPGSTGPDSTDSDSNDARGTGLGSADRPGLGQVFVAMEYVEGQDLRQWLSELPAVEDKGRDRPWRHIVDLFVQAGEGLAAAHAAGLLHRDFKPANVIVGADGRVRVADFGLARSVDSGVLSEPVPEGDGQSSVGSGSDSGMGGSSVIDLPMTLPGQLPGTPAYMSPEQLRGLPGDARSDQFAFCTALYEALFGSLPFEGRDRQGLLAEILAGRHRMPPRGSGVPAWLQAVVLRGLAADPDERHASMGTLLAQLRRKPWRRSLAVGLVAAGVALMAVIRFLTPAACSSGGAKLAGIWDPPRRASVLQAFEDVDRPYAGELGRRVAGILDSYSDGWVEMYTDSCLATRRGEQSPELLDRRTACLDRRLAELRALTDLMVTADVSMVDRSVSAVDSLGRLASCADTRTLVAVSPMPAASSARQAIEGLAKLTAETKASYLLGQGELADSQAASLVEMASGIDYAPGVAEAYHVAGLVATFVDRRDDARQAQVQALGWADAGGHDELRVWSLLSLVWLSEPEAARSWLRLAEGVLDRIDDPAARAHWYQADAGLRGREGDYAGAAEAASRGAELSRRHLGSEARSTGRVLATLGSAQYRLGRYPEALETFTEVARIRRLNFGSGHPEVAYSDHARGELMNRLGRHEEALEVLQEAHETLVAVHGEDHSRTVTVLASLGKARYRHGDLELAEADLERVVVRRRELDGTQASTVASALNDLALVFWSRGQLDAAATRLEEALEIHTASRGGEHPQTLVTRINLGRVFLELGRARRAMDLLGPAHRSTLESLGAEHPTSLNSSLALAEAYLELGEIERGARLVADTVARVEPDSTEPWLLGFAYLAQAQVAALQGDATALAASADAARKVLEKSGPTGHHFLKRLARLEGSEQSP